VIVVTDGVEAKEPIIALTQDLNPAGMGFRSPVRLPSGTRVRMSLPLASGTFDVAGRVMHVEDDHATNSRFFKHGIQFDETPLAILDAIELHVTHHAIPMWRMKYRQSINLFSRVIEVLGNIRGEKRRLVQLPAKVVVEADHDEPESIGIALVEDVSKGGARLLMEIPVEPGRMVRYEVPGTPIAGRGTVVFNRSLESPMRTRFVVGVAKTKARRMIWPKALSFKRSRIPATG